MCDVSIIIVNWNGAHHLPLCLGSLMSQTYRDFEIIVVDNASSDNSVVYVRDNFPQVKLICLETNRGFTGGNCAGYEVAEGRFIALLNNDTRVESEWLEYMIGAMHSNSSVGMCACKIVVEGTDVIDSVGDRFTTAFTGTKIGYLQQSSNFNNSHNVHGGCAAAILYRRSMLDKIGFLDDDFFFNHEDTDLNLRAWFCGWKCVYVPDSIVHHKVSATVGELSNMGVYYFSRNNEWVWIKNVPGILMIRFLPQRLVYELASALYFCFNKKSKSYFKGKFDAIKMVRKMLNKRRDVQRMIKLNNKQIVQDLVPVLNYLRSRLKR